MTVLIIYSYPIIKPYLIRAYDKSLEIPGFIAGITEMFFVNIIAIGIIILLIAIIFVYRKTRVIKKKVVYKTHNIKQEIKHKETTLSETIKRDERKVKKGILWFFKGIFSLEKKAEKEFRILVKDSEKIKNKLVKLEKRIFRKRKKFEKRKTFRRAKSINRDVDKYRTGIRKLRILQKQLREMELLRGSSEAMHLEMQLEKDVERLKRRI